MASSESQRRKESERLSFLTTQTWIFSTCGSLLAFTHTQSHKCLNLHWSSGFPVWGCQRCVRVCICMLSVCPSAPPLQKDPMTQLGVCLHVWRDARPQPWLAWWAVTPQRGKTAGRSGGVHLEPLHSLLPAVSDQLSSGLSENSGINKRYTYGGRLTDWFSDLFYTFLQ